MIEKIIQECLELHPCTIEVRRNELMSEHATFKVGGKADFYLRPEGENFCGFSAALFSRAKEEGIPVFILGGGANIVVSDGGIRGIVLDTGGYKGLINVSEIEGGIRQAVFRSGTLIDEAAEAAAEEGLSGLEFLAGMPGSIGGAVWMNARCYGREISDVLGWTEIIDIGPRISTDFHGLNLGNCPRITRIDTDYFKFGYKKSPFQEMDCLILNAAFNLHNGDKNVIKKEMEKYRNDRREKGHYLYPCAGSAFKNNRDFGKPTGKIIDELGLRGFQIGGAQVAPFHGNIVINTGNATAADIRALMAEVAARVKAATGFDLEPEIIFI